MSVAASALLTYNINTGDNLDNRIRALTGRAEVSREIEFFRENIGQISSAADLFEPGRGDNQLAFRLRNFLTQAFGLDDRADQTAILKNVLETPISFGPGLPNPENIANRLNDPRLQALGRVFDLGGRGAAVTQDPAVVDEVIRRYVTNAFEDQVGQQSEGARLALVFERTFTDIESGLDILANRDLLEVVRLALGDIPINAFSSGDPQIKARQLEDLLEFDPETGEFGAFTGPGGIEGFIQRFLVQYDIAFGGGDTTSPAFAATQLVAPINPDPGQLPPITTFAPLTLEAALTGGATPLGVAGGGSSSGSGVGGLF